MREVSDSSNGRTRRLEVGPRGLGKNGARSLSEELWSEHSRNVLVQLRALVSQKDYHDSKPLDSVSVTKATFNLSLRGINYGG